MRTTQHYVVFQRPFMVRGMDKIEPPGTYLIVTDDEEIAGLSFQAWRRASTAIRLPAEEFLAAQEQYTTIDAEDLIAAKARDVEGIL
jgi:hypothetical protein